MSLELRFVGCESDIDCKTRRQQHMFRNFPFHRHTWSIKKR